MINLKYSVKSPQEDIRRTYMIFIWHGAFLALTMSMLDYNTVFPALVANLTESKIIFGLLYSIMLGTPFIFNIILSSFMHVRRYKKSILLLGIYLRVISFLGMAAFAWFFGKHMQTLVTASLFFWIFLYSISGGFAGMAYSDIIGKLVKKGQRGKLFSSKQFATSIFSFLGGVVVLNIFALNRLSFPYNYAVILFIGSAGLLVASIAFWFIREPPSIIRDKEKVSLEIFIKKIPSILKKDKSFTRFIIVENMFSFSLMIYPFYMLYAKDILCVNETYVGRYLIFQTAGAVLSNFLWVTISRRWDSKMILKSCILIGSMIPVLAIILSKFGPGYYSLVFFFVGFLISGRAVGFESYILDIAPSDERIIYLGIRGTMNIFIVLLPILGGYFITYLGYYVTFIIVTAVMLAAFILLGKQDIR
jgi:MFS family permease